MKACIIRHNFSKRRICHIRTASYLDRAPSWYETTNRTMYIYSLGSYHNRSIYHYGETFDIDLIELELKTRVPLYERVMYIPLDHNSILASSIYKLISEKETVRIPVEGMELWKAFTSESIQDIIDMAEQMYKTSESD